MTLALLQESVLAWIIIYGPMVLSAAVFVGALGLPLPGTLFLIAAGAFVRQGILSPVVTPLVALTGVVIGDLIGYGLGRWAGGWLHRRYADRPMWVRANEEFQRRGGMAIFMTRWLLTPIAVPVNWVTGSSRYPVGKFLLYDVLGEATWVFLYGGLGYLFSSQWEVISEFINDFSGLIVGLVVLALGVYVHLKRPFSPRRHTPQMPTD